MEKGVCAVGARIYVVRGRVLARWAGCGREVKSKCGAGGCFGAVAGVKGIQGKHAGVVFAVRLLGCCGGPFWSLSWNWGDWGGTCVVCKQASLSWGLCCSVNVFT